MVQAGSLNVMILVVIEYGVMGRERLPRMRIDTLRTSSQGRDSVVACSCVQVSWRELKDSRVHVFAGFVVLQTAAAYSARLPSLFGQS